MSEVFFQHLDDTPTHHVVVAQLGGRVQGYLDYDLIASQRDVDRIDHDQPYQAGEVCYVSNLTASAPSVLHLMRHCLPNRPIVGQRTDGRWRYPKGVPSSWRGSVGS